MIRKVMILVLLFAVPLGAAEVLDNAAVVRMVGAGLSADVIVLKIDRSQGMFDTTSDGLIALKEAHVPDIVIRSMLLKGDATATQPASAPAPLPAAQTAPALSAGENVCVDVKFYTTGNSGLDWQRSAVCAGAAGVSVDEQTIALTDIVAQCTSKPSILAMGGSLLRGDQEWWISDAKETLKFRGKEEDLDRLASALTHARGGIPSGNCNDRAIRRRLVRP